MNNQSNFINEEDIVIKQFGNNISGMSVGESGYVIGFHGTINKVQYFYVRCSCGKTFLSSKRNIIGHKYKKKIQGCSECGHKRDGENKIIDISGKNGGIVAHHLDGYHWRINRRFDTTNLVTLCYLCHKNYHKEYGNRFNTRDEFSEFYKIFHPSKTNIEYLNV